MPPVRKQVAVFMSNTPLPPHISLTPPPLQPQKLWLFHHRSVEQWGMQPAACAHFSFSLAFIRLHLSTGCSLTHTLASHVSCLIPSTPLSLSWGRPSADQGHLSACNGGLRLWSEISPLTAQRRGTATTDAKTLPTVCAWECVCVRTGTALSHFVSTGLTQ